MATAPELKDYTAQTLPTYQAQTDKIDSTYAASSGVNSGVGSQAQLAQNNALQNNLTTIRANQANAVSDAQLAVSKIKTQYQDDVAAAVAQNDYEKAAALLSEYQAAQSVVSVAATQADEYYKAYAAQLANQEYEAEWARTASDTDYSANLTQAQTLAAYGDFSGYKALGYTDDQIAAMRAYWKSQQ